MDAETRHFAACGKPVKGRTDKKFCDDYCRNRFNNQLTQEAAAPVVKHINQVLKHNRGILQRLILPSEAMGKCPRQRLVDAGYNFQYLTHRYTNKKGSVDQFCYEYGYLPKRAKGCWWYTGPKSECCRPTRAARHASPERHSTIRRHCGR
jgi:hypothetical protein